MPGLRLIAMSCENGVRKFSAIESWHNFFIAELRFVVFVIRHNPKQGASSTATQRTRLYAMPCRRQEKICNEEVKRGMRMIKFFKL